MLPLLRRSPRSNYVWELQLDEQPTPDTSVPCVGAQDRALLAEPQRDGPLTAVMQA